MANCISSVETAFGSVDVEVTWWEEAGERSLKEHKCKLNDVRDSTVKIHILIKKIEESYCNINKFAV